MLILSGNIKTSSNFNRFIIVTTKINDVVMPAHAHGKSFSLKAQMQK
jgi:hypothetical protein